MFNYRHPSPRREEGGLRAAGQVALPQDPGNNGIPGDEFREVNFCRQAADLRAIGPELEAHFLTKPRIRSLAAQGDPQGPHGQPKGSQMVPKGAKWIPKGTKWTPKGTK